MHPKFSLSIPTEPTLQQSQQCRSGRCGTRWFRPPWISTQRDNASGNEFPSASEQFQNRVYLRQPPQSPTLHERGKRHYQKSAGVGARQSISCQLGLITQRPRAYHLFAWSVAAAGRGQTGALFMQLRLTVAHLRQAPTVSTSRPPRDVEGWLANHRDPTVASMAPRQAPKLSQEFAGSAHGTWSHG